MTKLELQSLGDLAAIAYDEAVCAYPRSDILERCVQTLAVLRREIAAAVLKATA